MVDRRTVIRNRSILFTVCLLFLFSLAVRNVDRGELVDQDLSISSDQIDSRLRSTVENGAVASKEGPLMDLGEGYAALGGDLLIAVKTTKKHYSTRLRNILDTWFRLAPEQIYFVTDVDDRQLNIVTGGHLIATDCPRGHHRQALCCKQAAELEIYIKSGRSWFCHFDDDNYVNVAQLMRTLSQYNPTKDWYLGRPSTKGPIETSYRDNLDDSFEKEKVAFWFATGGAGFCISKSLATKMAPYFRNDKFVVLCDRIRLPDDVTIGFIINYFLGKNLTFVHSFHSHLENMRQIPVSQLHEQISLSAGGYNGQEQNVVDVSAYFPDTDDPQRFKSLHCFLYPMATVCRQQRLDSFDNK